MRTVLNPSPMEAELMCELLPLVDALLLNRGEAEALLGYALPGAEEMAAALRKLYPHMMVVLTLGAQGAILAGEGETLRQSAFPVQAVDTTGAGDTFTGYFLASWMTEGNASSALEIAAAAAALAVTRNGAAPSIPTREETERFLRQHSPEK